VIPGARRELEMNQEITQKVIEIVANQLELEQDQVKPESSFAEDLKADSLAVVELVLALEESFGIEIPDEDTENIKTVKDAITYIETHKN
jgi:acyl carrier protein